MYPSRGRRQSTPWAAKYEKAAELGATDVLGSVWTRDVAWYTEQVGKIAEMAKRYGLSYNVEFLPWAGMRSLQAAITLVDAVGAENLYIMVDTLHAGRAGVTGAELARTDRKYFRFMVTGPHAAQHVGGAQLGGLLKGGGVLVDAQVGAHPGQLNVHPEVLPLHAPVRRPRRPQRGPGAGRHQRRADALYLLPIVMKTD